MNYKNSTAAKTTITRDVKDLDDRVQGNLFESIIVVSRRATQISKEMREELHAKLEEFATHQDNLEEIFENREQIEISKFYERLPKPHALAVQELLEGKVYFRKPELAIDPEQNGTEEKKK